MRTLTAALLLSLLLLTACDTTPKGAGSATSSNLMEAAQLIRTGQERGRSTLSALTALSEAQTGSLATLFGTFTREVNALDSLGQRLKKVNERMIAQGEAYFANWDAEIAKINNENIRERTAQRKQQVQAALEIVGSQYRQMSEAYYPFMDDLRDITVALKADLTLEGVRHLEGPIREAIESGEKTLKAADQVAESFEKLGLRMSSILPDAPETSAESKAESKAQSK